MWPFTRRHRTPDLDSEPDTSRQELVRSQLEQTLSYGWNGSGKTEAKAFFESLGPASDPSALVEGLSKRRPS